MLLPLAVELGKFLPLVAGEANVQPVLALLEGLSKSEETLVCQKAAASLSSIGYFFLCLRSFPLLLNFSLFLFVLQTLVVNLLLNSEIEHNSPMPFSRAVLLRS